MIIKGKCPVMELPIRQAQTPETNKHWPKPPAGWTALSVDGSYVQDIREASTSMVLRNTDG